MIINNKKQFLKEICELINRVTGSLCSVSFVNMNDKLEDVYINDENYNEFIAAVEGFYKIIIKKSVKSINDIRKILNIW